MPFVPGNSGISDVYYSNNVYANNVPIALHLPPGVVAGGVYVPVEGFQFEQFHAQMLIDTAGVAAAYDDPDSKEAATAEGKLYGDPAADTQPAVPDPQTDSSGAQVTSGSPIQPGNFSVPINYDEKLSQNFTIRNLSVGTTFPHDIVAQGGFSVQDILYNLQGLAQNILEPLRSQYPGFRINSGFRKGRSTSQHGKGMACDLQWPGLTAAGYTPIAQWIRNNLPFDQLIFEHGKSIWLHVSYNRNLSNQRGSILTYYPVNSPAYKPGLTNYYA